MDDTFHDMPEEVISKLPFFSRGDPGTALKHLRTVTYFIHKYCRLSQYNHEDVKIRVFGYSLKGDAIDWFRNCPEEYCLQDIVNAFTDKYIKQYDSPCAPSTTQNNENDLVENSTISRRFPDNSQDESTCTTTAQIHDSGKAETSCQISVDNDKHLVNKLIQMVKNMELNQEKIMADHAREICSMQSRLLALEANHEKEMNYMQNLFMAMKENNDKMIQNMESRLKMMEVNQTSLQHNLSTIEERHVKEIIDVNDKHSNQMADFQNKLEKMERSQIQSEISTDHTPPSLLKPFPSHHTEVSFPIKEELSIATKDDQAYVSPLTEYIEDKIGHTTDSSDIFSEHFQENDRRSAVVSLLTSQPTQTKRRKQKRRRKQFDSSDGREQFDIRTSLKPTLCRIGHGTSEKQPTDLPKSRQMLSIHYIEHI